MASKPAYQSARFKKELAEFQARWPDVRVSARDRVKHNIAMRAVNDRARKKKNRKKPVAT